MEDHEKMKVDEEKSDDSNESSEDKADEEEEDESTENQDCGDETAKGSNLSFRHRLHSEHCKLAHEAIRSSSDEYDKNILKLSTIFLGISLAFMKDIVHADKLTHLYSLYISWGLFGFTILAVIVSFQLSVQANLKHLAILDDYYLNENLKALNEKNKWNALVIVANISSGSFFILGIASSIYFVIFNFRGR